MSPAASRAWSRTSRLYPTSPLFYRGGINSWLVSRLIRSDRGGDRHGWSSFCQRFRARTLGSGLRSLIENEASFIRGIVLEKRTKIGHFQPLPETLGDFSQWRIRGRWPIPMAQKSKAYSEAVSSGIWSVCIWTHTPSLLVLIIPAISLTANRSPIDLDQGGLQATLNDSARSLELSG